MYFFFFLSFFPPTNLRPSFLWNFFGGENRKIHSRQELPSTMEGVHTAEGKARYDGYCSLCIRNITRSMGRLHRRYLLHASSGHQQPCPGPVSRRCWNLAAPVETVKYGVSSNHACLVLYSAVPEYLIPAESKGQLSSAQLSTAQHKQRGSSYS